MNNVQFMNAFEIADAISSAERKDTKEYFALVTELANRANLEDEWAKAHSGEEYEEIAKRAAEILDVDITHIPGYWLVSVLQKEVTIEDGEEYDCDDDGLAIADVRYLSEDAAKAFYNAIKADRPTEDGEHIFFGAKMFKFSWSDRSGRYTSELVTKK